jgi:hypothetical protein
MNLWMSALVASDRIDAQATHGKILVAAEIIDMLIPIISHW